MSPPDAQRPPSEDEDRAQSQIDGGVTIDQDDTGSEVSMEGSILCDAHRELLAAAAIDLEVAVQAGVRTVGDPADLPYALSSWRRHKGIAPGVLFPVVGPDGESTVQYRPDTPVELEGDERPRKYLFVKGERPHVNVHPLMADRVGAGTLLVVEGTKQHLAAVSAAGDDVFVVGLGGCNGWMTEGAPVADWNHLPVEDVDVVIAFDADVATSPDVHEAGTKLGEHLELLGARAIRFLVAPTGIKAGLDDYLATVAPERRAAVLAGLIAKAGPLPKKPPKKRRKPTSDDPGAAYFDSNGLRAVDLVAAVRANGHHALGPDGAVWTYDPSTGVYCDDEHALVAAVRDLLGNRWRGMHQRTMLDLLAAALAGEQRRLPTVPIRDLVCVANGMLDVRTGKLHPFDPSHLAYARLSVEWDPDATAPRFDRWLAEQCGTQADDLLEAVGLVLAPSAAQRKVPFLIGPTRSGKGTLMRLIEALVPAEHRSSETLHAIATNRFAVAQLHGKILNSAGDLSDHHVEDLATFKMLTGDDSVSAERKFRDSFTFRNSALFLFNANTPPTTSESSRAYLARVRPYLFPNSYEGAEDPSIERALMDELPGVLVRLVEAVQRWLSRGGYAPVNPIVADLFSRQSDPVAMFVAQALEPAIGEFVATSELHDVYRQWTAANGRAAMGRNKLLARAENALGPRQRERTNGSGPQGWRDWRLLPESQWSDDDSTYALTAPSITETSATSATSSPTSPHEEENEEGETPEVVVPHEAEIGQKAAEAAGHLTLVRGGGLQYQPAPCDVCGETKLLAPGRDTACVHTFGCPGRHRHPGERPTAPQPMAPTGTEDFDGLF